jgi:hypothetical protein
MHTLTFESFSATQSANALFPLHRALGSFGRPAFALVLRLAAERKYSLALG